MSEWKKVKIGSIVTSCLGKMLDAEKNRGEYKPYLANINVRWGIFDLTNLSKMRFEESEYERYVIKKDDLIICEGGEPGRCAIWDEQVPNMMIQKALHRVRAKDGLDIRFLYYWLLLAGKTRRLERYFTGSTIKHLPGDALAEIEVDLPSEAEQHAISKTLSIIDRKITLNNRNNAELKNISRLLYDYWFVQFDFPNAEGKPYRQSGGKMVWCEELKQEIPKGWKNKTIGDCVTQITTGLNPRQNFVLGLGSNRYITIKNIENGKLNFSKCDYIDDDAMQKIHNRSDISIGDILFTSIEPIGRLYRIWETPKDWDINESVFSMRADLNEVTTDYLYATMDSDNFRAKTVPLRTGSVQKGIRIGDLQSIRIIIPTTDILDEFTSKMNNVYKQMWLCEKQNAELTVLRDFLLPLLMNGQVRVERGGNVE